jgi:uncharacterized membrane protein
MGLENVAFYVFLFLVEVLIIFTFRLFGVVFKITANVWYMARSEQNTQLLSDEQ